MGFLKLLVGIEITSNTLMNSTDQRYVYTEKKTKKTDDS